MKVFLFHVFSKKYLKKHLNTVIKNTLLREMSATPISQMMSQQVPQQPHQHQPSNDQLFEDARAWFNNMNPTSRNQMIVTMYKLCLTTRDMSHEKLIESLNAQWNEKFNKQIDFIKRLTMENEVLSKNQELGINVVVNKLKDLESNLNSSFHATNNEISGLSSKITPSANGKIGEDYIDKLLSKIPNSSFTNVTQSKGSGDFLFVTGEIRIMIESKNWTDSSIKGNPKELDNFRKTAIEAKEEGKIDFAIMALHRVTSLKGRAMEIEMEITKKGSLILLYVTNLFNHPERILYAIDAGILLLKQQSQHTIDKDRFVYQINSFLKGIDGIEESIKERQKIIKDMTSLVKKDSEQILNLKHMLDNILNNTEQVSIKDRVIGFYTDLVKINGQRITKSMLETKCLENKIPARYVRTIGGIKTIKELALKQSKADVELNINHSDKESDTIEEAEEEEAEEEEEEEPEEPEE